jgi:hypothetical protein
MFYSLKPDGELDPTSLHGSCPTLAGNKWSATKWIHIGPFGYNKVRGRRGAAAAAAVLGGGWGGAACAGAAEALPRRRLVELGGAGWRGQAGTRAPVAGRHVQVRTTGRATGGCGLERGRCAGAGADRGQGQQWRPVLQRQGGAVRRVGLL